MPIRVKCITANLVLNAPGELIHYRFLPCEPAHSGPMQGEVHLEAPMALFEANKKFQVGEFYDLKCEVGEVEPLA